MKKRSKQNNPEQKTNNGVNNMEAEFAQDDQVVKALKRNAKKGQPDYSK